MSYTKRDLVYGMHELVRWIEHERDRAFKEGATDSFLVKFDGNDWWEMVPLAPLARLHDGRVVRRKQPQV